MRDCNPRSDVLGDGFQARAGVDQIDLADERFGQAMVVVEALGRAASAAVHRLRPEDVALAAEDIAAGNGGIDLHARIGRLVADFQLLHEELAGALEIVVVQGPVRQAGQGDPAAARVAGLLGDDVCVAQELVALAARIFERKQAVEPDGGVDDLPVETLGARGGVGKPGQDDRKFLVLIGVFGDGVVELAEIIIGEGIEHRRMTNLV
jgi:hypothetical protein